MAKTNTHTHTGRTHKRTDKQTERQTGRRAGKGRTVVIDRCKQGGQQRGKQADGQEGGRARQAEWGTREVKAKKEGMK